MRRFRIRIVPSRLSQQHGPGAAVHEHPQGGYQGGGFEIIPATEPSLNYLTPPTELPILVYAAAWILKPNGVGYTNGFSTTRLELCYGSDFSTRAGQALENFANGDASDTQVFNNYFGSTLTNFNSWVMGFEFGSNFLGGPNYNDNGVYAAIENGEAGDLTGGDAANTLKIEVVYRVMTAA
jgi:hypothetical protein